MSLGQNPGDRRQLQARLYRAAGGAAAPEFSTEQEGRTALCELFSRLKCLIVLDDVWEPRSAQALDVGGTRCRVLVTTRREDVLRELLIAQEPVRVRELDREQALALLAHYAGLDGVWLPAEAEAIVGECGELPLALAMVGSALRGRPIDRWRTWLQRLKARGLSRLDVALPGYPEHSLIAALELSIDDLPGPVRDRFMDLAVFPEEALIPEATLQTYWAPDGLDQSDVQDVVDELVDRALARRDGEGRIFLHDIVHDYLCASVSDLHVLERRLVAAYRSRSPEGFHTGPNDGYFFRAFLNHLFRAEGVAAVRELLFDFRWLAAKLVVTKTNALLMDFEMLPLEEDRSARLLDGALWSSPDTVDSQAMQLAC